MLRSNQRREASRRGLIAGGRAPRTATLGIEACEPRQMLTANLDVQLFLEDGVVLTGGFNKRVSGAAAIAPYQQVFVSTFTRNSSGAVTVGDPGFNASRGALPNLWRTTLDVVSGLSYWDGRGATPAFAPVTGGVEINVRAGTSNIRVGAANAGGKAFVQTVPSSGEVHTHLTSSIGVGGTGQSFVTAGGPDGIYAFQATVGLDPPSSSSGLTPARSSLPVWFVYSLDEAGTAGFAAVVERARDHLRDRAIGTATVALAVDDGASPTDGVSTNGTVSVGGLNPRARWEFSTNGGATWAALGREARFTLPQGTYAAGRVQVRQQVTDHYGSRTVTGSNAQAFTISPSGQPQPPVVPPTPQPPVGPPTPPAPEPPVVPPTPQPPVVPPTPEPPVVPPVLPPTPEPPVVPPTPQPPVLPPSAGPPIVLPPLTVAPPMVQGRVAAIPLVLTGIPGRLDRLDVDHLTLLRGGRRVSLARATIESAPDGTHTLVVPKGLVAPRAAYRLVVGGGRVSLFAGNVPVREIVTMEWRSRQPSRDLAAAVASMLQPQRPAVRGRVR
jgi:hypothetical protein